MSNATASKGPVTQGVRLIPGESFADPFRTLVAINEFPFGNFRRFYILDFPPAAPLGPWLAHQEESKAFMAVQGSLKIWVVSKAKPPGEVAEASYDLSARDPAILVIPAGNATLFQSEGAEARIVVFSSLSLADGSRDLVRYPPNHWRIA